MHRLYVPTVGLKRGLWVSTLCLLVGTGCGPTPRQQAAEKFNQGNALRRAGQDEPALVAYSEAIALAPDYAKAYNNRAAVYLAQGRPELAIADWTRVIGLAAAPAGAYHNRGLAHARSSDPGFYVGDPAQIGLRGRV